MIDIRGLFANRIGGRDFGTGEIYKFERIKRAKREAIAKNPDVKLIDLGVGEPDESADESIVEVLAREAGKPENRFYADNGISEYKAAAALYLERVYGVRGIDPETEIIHGIGSKPVLALLPLCLVNPGEYALVTVPGYPVTATYTKYAGGSVYPLPLLESNGFLPDLSSIPASVANNSKLLYINYPNNPTGACATPEFFTHVMEFANKYNIAVIHDASYASIVFDGYKPLSYLSIDGAKETGVEIFSMSKAYNMTGWRLSFVAGNSLLVNAYGAVKDNTDSGQFRAIQKAGAFALGHPEITDGICEKYSRRFDLLVAALRDIGFDARKPHGTFYCFVRSPSGTRDGIAFRTAFEASDYILRHALVSTVPWDDAGPYLRLSVTFEAQGPEEELRVVEEVRRRLEGLKLVFERKQSL
jgi:LL-diaminopimelate aminotransferase